MPVSVLRAYIVLAVPTVPLLILLILQIIAVKKAEHAKVRKVLLPMWKFAWTLFGIAALSLAIIAYPYYAHQQVWSHAILRKVRLFTAFSTFAVSIWLGTQVRAIYKAAREVNNEYKTFNLS